MMFTGLSEPLWAPLACIAERSSLVSWLAVVLLALVLVASLLELELVSESDAAACA